MAKTFFEALFRLKGVIFITTGKRQRSLWQCTAPTTACKGRTFRLFCSALQAAVVVQSFLRRSMTCGYENTALRAVLDSYLFCIIIAPQKKF
ncbi:MAG: hypothetical protein LBT29_06160 [Flavobacteriaceae bacterium]|nr:hypothetical protein [Flavobacteriaceae bacterium]